jgi:hypothetical protein
MDSEAVAGEPLGPPGHDPPSVRFPLAPDDDIIGETRQEASAIQPWPYLTREPLLPDMREEDIRQYR